MFFKTKKTLALLLTLAMTLVMLSPVGLVSADALVEADVAVATKATGIKVDGDLSEGAWLSADWYEVARRQEATTLNNTVQFATAWNSSNLYVAVKVVDSVIVAENLDANIYNNDGVEVFIDPQNIKGEGLYTDKTIHMMIQAADGKTDIWGGADKWSSVADQFPGAQIKHVLTADGYTVEIGVPFAELGITGANDGTVIGLEVNNNDDDNPASAETTDRGILFWNDGVNAGDPSTWGNVIFSNTVKPVISYLGTPAFDGKVEDSEGWVFTSEKVNDNAGVGFKLASMCDAKNVYIALVAKGEGLDQSAVSFFFDPLNSKDKEGVSLLQIINFMHSTGEDDYTRYGVEGAFNYTTNVKAMGAKTSSGYTVELEIPLDTFDEKPVYLDSLGMEIDFFKIKDDYGNGRMRWSSASEDSMWSGSSSYGSVLLNNIMVGGGKNNAPTGNQISTYSIAQGEKISGKITVFDIDEGDTLSYAFDINNDIPGEDKGTFKLDEKTGEWSYATPDAAFLAPDGVSYFVEVKDSQGATFHQRVEIRVESKPTNLTYHVDGDTGSDMNDGTSATDAFKTIQAAVKIAKPGDTILIHESAVPYCYAEKTVLDIKTSGLPDAYITYKAAPGEKPVINSNGKWKTVIITGSYIKFEGITIDGFADEIFADPEGFAKLYDMYYHKALPNDDPEYNSSWGDDVSYYNTPGISIDPADTKNVQDIGIDKVKVVHHVEVRDCLIEYVTSAGIGTSSTDYITIENNTIVNNGWTDMYATSGISSLGNIDIDTEYDKHKMIIRNNVIGGNRHFMPWITLRRYSDGNGIIIDSTNNISKNNNLLAKGDLWGLKGYEGRHLVANNVCYLSGGSGIHVFDADYTDLINNTVFSNSSTPILGYSDFYASQAKDVKMYNNIVYSRTGAKMNISSTANVDIVYDNNLFFNYDPNNNNLGQNLAGKGGKTGTIAGANNIYGQDPLFVKAYAPNHDTGKDYPSSWPAEAKEFATNCGYFVGADYSVPTDLDFSIASNSPAIGTANAEWAKVAGLDTKNMGAQGTIGSSLKPMTVGVGGEGTPTTPVTPPVTGGDPKEMPFTDVSSSDWFYENVKYAFENKLMNGTSDTTFAPEENVTRAMFVTVLYRIEGQPAADKSAFTDIEAGSWYEKAVAWASANGIVNGTSDTTFSPDDNVTREQIAAIIYRYAKAKGYDVSVGESTNILSYEDFSSISEYAIEAIQYVNGSKIMNGKTEVTLAPADFATRAETATMLVRFINAVK